MDGGGGGEEPGTFRAPLGDTDVIPRIGPDEHHLARAALKQFGACVFTHVATQAELDEREALFWEWAAKAGTGIRREDPSTLCNENWEKIAYSDVGVIAKMGAGQSSFLWSCRMLESVQNVFKTVWGTEEEMATSFDGCGAFRNPFLAVHGENWYTKQGWYHVDQNANIEPNLDTYQGLLNFFPANHEASGSTVVCPGSHQKFGRIFNDPSRQAGMASFVKLDTKADFDKFCRGAVMVPLLPGDFLVWDSRTVHCNQGINPTAPIEEVLGERATAPLARLVAYICMIPRSRIDAKTKAARREFVINGFSGPHHPVRIRMEGRQCTWPGYRPFPDSDPRWKLV